MSKATLEDDRDLYSGLIRLHVLHHAVKEPIFGLGMIEELARHGYKISAGSLYPLLQKLAQKGYLRSTEVRNGKSVFKIVGMDAKEFPQIPKFDAKALSTTPASTVREMIERTIFSVSMDETRYSLNGVFIEEGYPIAVGNLTGSFVAA